MEKNLSDSELIVFFRNFKVLAPHLLLNPNSQLSSRYLIRNFIQSRKSFLFSIIILPDLDKNFPLQLSKKMTLAADLKLMVDFQSFCLIALHDFLYPTQPLQFFGCFIKCFLLTYSAKNLTTNSKLRLTLNVCLKIFH